MSANIQVGDTLYRIYRIDQVLSTKGGMGVLYLAHDQQQQRVAIKRNRETTPDACEQFKREAHLLLSLRHPNLVRVETYFEEAGAQFLVMEYIPGSDLDDLIKQQNQPFTEDKVIEWGKILCNVLTYLHTQSSPIIHRDLKPGNIKIKPDGALVLVDFGIAKELKSGLGQYTQRGARGVTPGFSPPEQYLWGKTNQTSDIYALGATLYFLLTNHVPDDALARDAQARKNLPTLNLAGISLAMQRILTKAMQIEQASRYQTMHELISELTRAQNQVLPLTNKPCPNPSCRALNRDNATFCARCGSCLNQPSSPTMCPQCAATLPPNAKACPACNLVLMPVSQPSSSANIICPNCHTSNRPTAKFCAQCRSPLPVATAPGALIPCPRCKSPNRPNARFCANCRTPLAAPVAPTAPPRPVNVPPAQPLPLAPGACPQCGNHNPPSEIFCQQCGYALQTQPPPAKPSPQPPQQPHSHPKPAKPISPLPEQRQVGWILFAIGIVSIPFVVWLASLNSPFIIASVPLGLLGIFTALAGRDLLKLFDAQRRNAPAWLKWVFGDERRGRVWGAIAAVMWIVASASNAWLILPLAILGAMMFSLNVLVGKAFTESLGVHYARPGWVIVIGWLLTFSGVGTISGIALLIPKPWAKIAANIALVVLGLLGAFGIIVSLINVVAASSASFDWTIPGTSISALWASAASANLALCAGAIAALRYLANAQLTFSTATAQRRELNVAAWTLIGMSIATFIASFIWVAQTSWLVVFWLGIGISVCALVAARDLLALGDTQLNGVPLLVGSMSRGRKLGVVAASTLALVSIALAWMIWTIPLVIIAGYLIVELMSVLLMSLCNDQADAPAGVTWMGWALVPTGIGTFPGIQLLRHDQQGWRWARPSLVLLFVAGIGIITWALVGVVTPFQIVGTLVSCGTAISIASISGLGYMHRPNVKKYFRV